MWDLRHDPFNILGTFYLRRLSNYEEMLSIHGLQNWTDIEDSFESTSIKRFHQVIKSLIFYKEGQCSSFAILKQETDVSLISFFHCLVRTDNFCTEFSETGPIPHRCANATNIIGLQICEKNGRQ